MGYLGLDDTDSLMGGCTTHLFSKILGNLPDYATMIGLPRLVRLYPFAQRRTRGNAAVCAEIEIKDGLDDEWLKFLGELLILPGVVSPDARDSHSERTP